MHRPTLRTPFNDDVGEQMAKITKLTFYSDGVRLSGLLYEPDDLKPAMQRVDEQAFALEPGQSGPRDVT